ncbi:MAG: 16S rRNA (cytidine(1402)-2'-O)-methyltransferase [Phycisphaerae bacterium]|nr:16S rRNA (cytidine(1402)-2'-O)-methyltransferase [Phycisphaerae bacterium]
MLYFVATPIGNMSDITLRAIEVLKAVDMVASEDTRRTGRLLKQYDISKPQMSFHEHNKAHAGARILGHLAEGKDVALVADAGTPGISDPGYTLVRSAIEHGCEFTMVPGPCAFVMALVLSGLPTHGFTFRGFAPKKSGQRQRFLAVDAQSPHTLIFYESPYRVKKFLQDALVVFGDRQAVLARELTKMFESVDRGPMSQLIETIPEKPKGEYVILVHGCGEEKE